MIKRISLALILVCLLVALPLALMGIKHVEIGPAFLGFMKNTVRDLDGWKFEIPQIPTLARLEKPTGWLVVLDWLIWLCNAFFAICNLAITVMNVVIYVIQFIIALIKNLISFKDTMEGTGDTSYNPWPIV